MAKQKREDHEALVYIKATYAQRLFMMDGLRGLPEVKGFQALRMFNRCLSALTIPEEELAEHEGEAANTITTRFKITKATVLDLLDYVEAIPWRGGAGEVVYPFLETMHHVKTADDDDDCFKETLAEPISEDTPAPTGE